MKIQVLRSTVFITKYFVVYSKIGLFYPAINRKFTNHKTRSWLRYFKVYQDHSKVWYIILLQYVFCGLIINTEQLPMKLIKTYGMVILLCLILYTNITHVIRTYTIGWLSRYSMFRIEVRRSSILLAYYNNSSTILTLILYGNIKFN